ncbi:MAG: hypothetical protein WCH58_00970 [Candidatus Saccharibacteria bacterium]
MNNELDHLKHPFKLSLFWVVVYVLIAGFIIGGANIAANQIRTHTLPTGDVTLTIPYSKYVVGESVNFTIKNNYNSSISILNNCPAEPLAVYRQASDGSWIRQHDYASYGACSTEQRQVSVAAGQSVSGNFDPWPNLFVNPGKYRVVAFVEYYNALPYQEFEVVAPKTASTTQQQSSNIADSTSAVSTPSTASNSSSSSQSTSTSEKSEKSHYESDDD